MTDVADHLSPAARAVAELPPIERFSYLQGQWWIAHAYAQAALARLDAVYQFGPGRIRRPNLLIVGPTNNGKSMIAEKFRRLHPPVMSKCGRHEIVPVVIMQMPTEPGVRRFYASVLTALTVPLSFNLPGERLERSALHLLRTVEARVLIVDELHNLLAGTLRRRAEFLNMLRFLGNKLRIPIVAIGTKQAQIALRSDDQLENRFEPVPIPIWQNNALFGRLLASFERAIPLRTHSGLADCTELRTVILRRSGGLIGEIAAFLMAATKHALLQEQECLDRATLQNCEYRGPEERRALFEASFPRVR